MCILIGEVPVDYIFLVIAVVWIAQFGLAYWQLRRFHGRIGELRRYGRTAVGMHGNRWRGRTYAVLAINGQNIIQRAEVFAGWTVFSQLKPVESLQGQPLRVLAEAATAPAGMSVAHWEAFRQAAQFLQAAPATQAQALAS